MTPRGSSHLPLLLAAVLLLVPPGSRAALAQGGTGVIEGVVRDSGGAVLPGVTLSLQNQAAQCPRLRHMLASASINSSCNIDPDRTASLNLHTSLVPISRP